MTPSIDAYKYGPVLAGSSPGIGASQLELTITEALRPAEASGVTTDVLCEFTVLLKAQKYIETLPLLVRRAFKSTRLLFRDDFDR
jgi:hypothetical protein